MNRTGTRTLVTLATSATGLLALAIYQWLELLEVRQGRPTACSVNEVINCATVWDSPFSHLVHDTLGLPVAGLGVLWGAVALLLSFLLSQRAEMFIPVVKVWAAAGVLACITFISASLQAKAVCLTCFGTYVLTGVYAFAALKLGGAPVPSAKDVPGALGWSVALSLPLYFALLFPGGNTPRETVVALPAVKNHAEELDPIALLNAMPPAEAEMVSWALAEWKKAPFVDHALFPVHAQQGPGNAPVTIVEFTDILCPHCAQSVALMAQLEKLAPGKFSVEPRYFPLDPACNPALQGGRGDGVRCYGAKVQICAEQHPRFFELRQELFARQRELDMGLILGTATRFGLDADELAACIKSEATAARLKEDLAYAKAAKLEGTPLLLLNGKQAPPVPLFLLGMVVNGGDVNAPVFAKLPPPPSR